MNREQLEALPRVEIERLFNSFVDLHPVRVEAFLDAVEATGWDRGLFDFSVASMDFAAKWFVERYWPGADVSGRASLPASVFEPIGEAWWSTYDPLNSTHLDKVSCGLMASSYLADVALSGVPGSFFHLTLDSRMADAFVPRVGSVSLYSRLMSGTALAKSPSDRSDYAAFYESSLRGGVENTTAHRDELRSSLIGIPRLVGGSSWQPSEDVPRVPDVDNDEGPEVGVGGGVVSIVHDLMADDDRLDRFRTLLHAAFGHVSFEDNEIVEFEIDDENGVAHLVERLWVQSSAE